MKPFKGARVPLPKPEKKRETAMDMIDAMHADAMAEIERMAVVATHRIDFNFAQCMRDIGFSYLDSLHMLAQEECGFCHECYGAWSEQQCPNCFM